MPSSSATTTTARQTKRPYSGGSSLTHHQPAITAYFQSHPSSAADALFHQDTNTNTPLSLSPRLPPLVQSNLLSVGMRVRKSVPEGYKTGKMCDGGAATMAVAMSSRGAGECRSAAAAGAATCMELVPFCGILKVGGMAVQQQGWGRGAGGDYGYQFSMRDGDGDGDGGFSSQDSSASVDTVSSMGRKRRRDGDLDDDREGLHVQGIWMDDDELELSPKSRPVGLVGAGLGRRPVAIPKSRRVAALGGTKRAMVGMEGQENMMDFEEAEFLDYHQAWDGEEVVMRDI